MVTLAEMRTAVYRDLADDGTVKTFTSAMVDDFIRGGCAEMNRLAPSDTNNDITVALDVDTGIISTYTYTSTLMLPYRVEARQIVFDPSQQSGIIYPLPMAEDGQSAWAGWVWKQTETGGSIEFPRWMLNQMVARNSDTGDYYMAYTVRLHGYYNRPKPTTDSSVVTSSMETEYAIRMYAKAQGFDMLSHDRGLFGQWQGQTNNTDVSPTQMMQMASQAKSEWEQYKGQIRVVRKYW